MSRARITVAALAATVCLTIVPPASATSLAKTVKTQAKQIRTLQRQVKLLAVENLNEHIVTDNRTATALSLGNTGYWYADGHCPRGRAVGGGISFAEPIQASFKMVQSYPQADGTSWRTYGYSPGGSPTGWVTCAYIAH